MAAARESISPLLRNVQSRRLSLELCQKIGNHLLSPSRNNNTGSNNGGGGSSESLRAASPSTSVSSSPTHHGSRYQSSSSPQRPSTPQQHQQNNGNGTNYHRRGSLGCIGSTASPLLTNSYNAFSAANANQTLIVDDDNDEPIIIYHGRRRSSLQPIYSNPASLFEDASTSSTHEKENNSEKTSCSRQIPTIDITPLDDDKDLGCQNQRNGNTGEHEVEWKTVDHHDYNYSETSTKKSIHYNNNNYNNADGDEPQLQQSPSSVYYKGNEGELFLKCSKPFCNVIVGGGGGGGGAAASGSGNGNNSDEKDNVVLDDCYHYNNNGTVVDVVDGGSHIYSNLAPNANNHQSNNGSSLIYYTNSNSNNSLNKALDLDETFASLVAQQCPNLLLNPNEILGKGSFGTVLAGLFHGQQVAVKVIHTTSPKHMISLAGERNAFRLAPHPNIARIYEILQLSPAQSLIIMERLRNGSLLTTLNNLSVYLSDKVCIRFAAEIASALYYCHSNGILHLDVKPSNVLIDEFSHCKLADFGNSKPGPGQELQQSNFAKLDGTVAYIAPECFRGVCPTDKCDVYSFGVTMWQILSRESPYQGETEHSIIYKVVAQAMRPMKTNTYYLPNFSSKEKLDTYKNLYELCWAQIPECRPNMQAVLEKLLFLDQ